MDERIDIRQFSETVDGTGGVTPTWTNLATGIWARVEYTTQSSEGMRGEDQQVVSYRIVKFTIRAEYAVTEIMRILYDGSEYDILSISKLGRNRFLIIEAEKRDNQT